MKIEWMRNLLAFTFIAIMVFSALKCEDGETPFQKPGFYKGTIAATVNDASWSACPYAVDGVILAILSDYFDIPSGRREQTLSIHLPQHTGTFTFGQAVDSLNNKALILFSFVDSDAQLADYELSPGKENGFVNITSYDPVEGKITGTFESTLYLRQNFGMENPPDSLVIKNGQFETWFTL